MLGASGFRGAGGLFCKTSMICALRTPSRKARLPVNEVSGGRKVHVVVGTPWTAAAQKTAVAASKSQATRVKVTSTIKTSPEALEAAYNELWYGIKGEYQPGLVVRQADSTEGAAFNSSGSSSITADITIDSNESQALNVAQGFSIAAEQPEQPAAQATNAVTVWGTTATVTAAAGAACGSIEDQSACDDNSTGEGASEQGSDGMESAATLPPAAAAAAAAASLPQSLQELAAPTAPTTAAEAAVALMMMRHKIAAAVAAASRQGKAHTPNSTEAAASETPLRAKLLPPVAHSMKTASTPASSSIKGCTSLRRIRVGSSVSIKVGSSLRGRAAMPQVRQLGGPVRPAAATMRHSLCPTSSSSSSSMNPILGLMRAKIGAYNNSSSSSSRRGATLFNSSSSPMLGYNSYVAVRIRYSARLMAQTSRMGNSSSSSSSVSSIAAVSPVSAAAASAALLPAAAAAAAAAPKAASSHSRGAALLSSSVGGLVSHNRCSSSSGGGSNDTAPVSDRQSAPKGPNTGSSSSSSKVSKMVQQFNTAATAGSSGSDGNAFGSWGYLQLCNSRRVRLASQCSINAGAAAAHKAAEGASLAVAVV